MNLFDLADEAERKAEDRALEADAESASLEELEASEAILRKITLWVCNRCGGEVQFPCVQPDKYPEIFAKCKCGGHLVKRRFTR